MRWFLPLLLLLSCWGCQPPQTVMEAASSRVPQTTAEAPAPSSPPPGAVQAPSDFIDMHAHVFFDVQQAQGMSTQRSALASAFFSSFANPSPERIAVIVIAPRGDPAATVAQNDKLLAFAAKHDAVLPVASVHPDDADAALEELKRLAARGVRFIKLHPNTQKFDVDASEVHVVVELAAELNMVVLFDAWSPFDADQAGKFLMLAVQHPKARIILAHMGGARFLDMLVFHAVAHYPWYPDNVWFDLSASSHMLVDGPYAESFVWVARKLGVNRLLHGSDFPLVDPATAYNDLARMGFTTEELRLIMHDNAAALIEATR